MLRTQKSISRGVGRHGSVEGRAALSGDQDVIDGESHGDAARRMPPTTSTPRCTCVAVSLFLFEVTALSAGGIITPAYVALVLDDAAALGLLGGVTVLTWFAVAALSRGLFLFSSRRFSVTLLIGVTLSAWAHALLTHGVGVADGLVLFGFVVPGLIAHQFVRQGVVPTLVMIAIAAPIVRILALAVARI